MSLMEREARKTYGITPDEYKAFVRDKYSPEADAIREGSVRGLSRRSLSHLDELPRTVGDFAGWTLPGYALTYFLTRRSPKSTKRLWYGFDTALGLASAGAGHHQRMRDNRLYNSAYDKMKNGGAGLVKESGLVKGLPAW